MVTNFSLYEFFALEVEGEFTGIIGAVEIFKDGFFFFLNDNGESGAKIGEILNELDLRPNLGVFGELSLSSESTSLSSFCLLEIVEIDMEISWDNGFTNFNITWTGISLWSGWFGINRCINILGI